MTTATLPRTGVGHTPAASVAEDRDRLEEWIGSVIPGCPIVPVAAAPTDTSSAGEAGPNGSIALVLFELAPLVELRRDRELPFRLRARYHLQPRHADPLQASQWVEDLYYASAEEVGFDIDAEAPDLGWWAAFGSPPRPCITLQTVILRMRPQPTDVRRVEEPLVLTVTDTDGDFRRPEHARTES